MLRRHHDVRLLRHALLVALAAGSACGAEAVTAPAVAISFDDNGLSSLTYDGFEYLSNGHIGTTWNDAAIQRRLDGTTVVGDMTASRLTVDATHRTIVRTFAWGILRCIYTADGSRLSMTMFATNTSQLPIAALQLQALELKFPGKPREYDLVTPIMTANIGAPTILTLTTDRSLVVACNDDVDQPLSLGYPWANDRPAATVFPLYVDTGHRDNIPRSHPTIDRVIHPGCTDCYHLSLRFGPPTATLSQLAGDILAKFRQVHPSQLVWKDRRPIGALFLSSTVPHVPANPRGWFGNHADIDTTTDEGRAAFKTALMRYADTSIAEMKLADAQGMITWDPEGQEHPHATSYLGDPRNLPPEMDPIIDEYFRKFTDAKLRVGVCVRPQRAGVSFYGAHASQVDIPPWDQFAWLNDKIAYAKKRWGCTIFYIDSNVDRQHGDYICSDPAVFRKLAAANPDVLLMPEHECAAYWSFSAPYNELRQNWTSTPALARALYPDSFSIIYVADGAIEKRRDELVRSVRAGDILLFRGWWDDPDNKQLRAIYQEAKQGSKPAP